jgi:LysM repeat protein
MRLARAAIASLLLLGTGLPAEPSATKTHVVRDGESMTAISKRYYGHFDHAGLLMLHNGKTSARLRVGETLEIPVSVVHRVEPGDTWSGICRASLGRVSVYRAVARLNGRDPSAPLQVGESIVIPASVPYRLRRGDSLSALAERHLGSAELADVIAIFNGIEDPRRLSVGQRLELPIVSLRLAKPPVAEPPVADPRVAEPEPTRDATVERALGQRLDAALTAYRDGRFRSALEMLEALREETVEASPEHRARLWTQISFAYAAFDRQDDVCDAWRRLSPAEASRALDHRLASPKIERMARRCDGAPESSAERE